MTLDYTISHEPPLIVVRTAGIFDFLRTYEMWREIVRSCKARRCFRILGISSLQEAMPLMDAFESFNMFESVGITNAYRIAWVAANPAVLEELRLVETVLTDRGLTNHHVFESAGNAREWLLAADELNPATAD